MDKFVKKRSEPFTSSESVGKKTRLYNDSYLNYSFASLDGKPQCVVCSQVLSNESMKPSKLVQHLETKHPAHKNKPLEFFKRKLHTLRNQQTSIYNLSHTDKSVLEASYLVALRVAKMSKPHTIAKNLILPAAVDMITVLIGVEEAKILKNIPLSDDTISGQIDDMAADVHNQIIQQVSSSEFFSIQFDESTDVANMSQLCFVRYECDRDTSLKENMLFCKTVPGHATGQCLFDVFYEATRNYTNIDWTKCIAVCSDGAKVITGKNSELMKMLRDCLIIPRVEWMHCFLHRHALVTKNMPENLNQILCEVVKLVNFIKSQSLQNRLFAKLYDEMDENKKSLLFHTEVRWLSQGKVLIWFI
ncbi:SCAN domain-containing protein 3-like [Centruroides vittatus]|uniref:SCAN domain-containing protein 3-like n=1 Tax=Centruroides vittatus TaxID=120091 RepID=UPI0035108EBD